MALFKSLFASFFLCDFEDAGILTVFKEEKNFKAYAQTQEFLADFGLQAEKIKASRLLELEPALQSDLAGAWLNKTDLYLRPELLMKGWRRLLEDTDHRGKVLFETTARVSLDRRVDQPQTHDLR